MFEVGDRVFYGVVGVCEVEDIAAPPIKGIDGKYYYLQPVYDDKGIIYSPVDSKKVSMRTIITKEEAQTFLERARNCKSDELLNQKITPNQYDEMVKSQDTEKLMHLVRFLYDIKNERAKELRKMKSADSRMLVTARKLLYGELAVALGKDYSEMSDLLECLRNGDWYEEKTDAAFLYFGRILSVCPADADCQRCRRQGRADGGDFCK